MAAEPNTTGIIGNVIAMVVAGGSFIMFVFSSVKWGLGVGRDARDARDMGLANGKVLAAHDARFNAHDVRLATVEANAQATKDSVERIEASVAELLRRTPRR